MFPYFIKDKISSMKALFITLLILFYFEGEAKFPIIFVSVGIYLLKGNNRNNMFKDNNKDARAMLIASL